MRIPKTSITLVLTFGLWLGLVLGCSSLRKAANEKRAEREGAPITISAEDLYKAYESSEADADKLYQGRILIVTGTVGTSDAKIPVVLLMDARQKPNILCGFAADQKGAVSKLEPGQMVTGERRVSGKGNVAGIGSLAGLRHSVSA